MASARNLLQDYYDGTLEDEQDFEPIHSTALPKVMPDILAHHKRQKLVDTRRRKNRHEKETLIETRENEQ